MPTRIENWSMSLKPYQSSVWRLVREPRLVDIPPPSSNPRSVEDSSTDIPGNGPVGGMETSALRKWMPRPAPANGWILGLETGNRYFPRMPSVRSLTEASMPNSSSEYDQ